MNRDDVFRHWHATVRCFRFAFSIVVALATARTAQATDYSWINPAGGLFNTPTNWTPNGVPGPSDNINFSLESAAGYSVTATNLVVGGSSTGSLSISGGASLNGSGLSVGVATSSMGTVSVSSQNSSLNITQVILGDLGTGSLAVSAGGTVDGTDFDAGALASSTGTITVNDPNSLLSLTQFDLGDSGTGSLAVGAGGTVKATVLDAGNRFGSTAMISVSGPNSLLSVNQFNLGDSGTGSLAVSNGASVGATGLYVGSSTAGGVGTITVDGNGTTLGATGLTVGSPSSSISITGGATATGTTVTVDQGTMTIGSTSRLSANGLQVNQGTLDIQGGTVGAVEFSNSGNVKDNGLIVASVNNGANGKISGDGSIQGTLYLNTGGAIAPGNSPGTLTVGSFILGMQQNVAASTGTFQFEINSASGTAGGLVGWNLLASQGAASLNGTLTLDLESLTQTDGVGKVFDFDPKLNYHWTFLTAADGITGFNPADFVINTAGFANPIYGAFSASEVGNSLVLNYQAPEPSTLMLAAAAGLALFVYGCATRDIARSRSRWSRGCQSRS